MNSFAQNRRNSFRCNPELFAHAWPTAANKPVFYIPFGTREIAKIREAIPRVNGRRISKCSRFHRVFSNDVRVSVAISTMNAACSRARLVLRGRAKIGKIRDARESSGIEN